MNDSLFVKILHNGKKGGKNGLKEGQNGNSLKSAHDLIFELKKILRTFLDLYYIVL